MYTNENIDSIVYEIIFDQILSATGKIEDKIGKLIYFNDFDRMKFDHAIDRISEVIADNLK